tara:strand:+ start:316 stop:1605 length:1290 start_codon:yes stop_codon:yes gene_type:complete
MSKKIEKLNFIDIVGTNNCPPSIKDTNIPTRPATANSYVYEFECMNTGMKYIGYHKDNGKIYWNSSTDGDFKKVLADSNSNLTFKVLAYGSVKEMLQKEHELLTLVDAKNNSMYWNKTNGQPGVLPIDREAIHHIVKMVETTNKQDLDILMTISELYNIKVAQTRELLIDRDNLNDIKDAIRRQAGNTDEANPPVLLEDRVYDGVSHEFLRIGGTHTITSYWELDYKDTELPVIIIPKELHESITDDGLTLLGNLLNKKTSISAPATHEDGTKTLYEYHEAGRDWKSPECRQDLYDMGLSSSKVDTAVKNCQAMIDNDEARKAGMVVMDYKGKHEHILNDVMENWELSSPTTYVNSSSSAAITMDRILWDFRTNKLDNQDNVRWFVYHPNKSTRDVAWPKLKNKLDLLFVEWGIPVVFQEMELYTKSVK